MTWNHRGPSSGTLAQMRSAERDLAQRGFGGLAVVAAQSEWIVRTSCRRGCDDRASPLREAHPLPDVAGEVGDAERAVGRGVRADLVGAERERRRGRRCRRSWRRRARARSPCGNSRPSAPRAARSHSCSSHSRAPGTRPRASSQRGVGDARRRHEIAADRQAQPVLLGARALRSGSGAARRPSAM